MKTLFTLCGWVVVGAVLAFGGQQIWKAYKANNPERSDVIAEKVTDAAHTGADALRETADAVRDELAPSTNVSDAQATPDEPTTENTVAEAVVKDEPTENPTDSSEAVASVPSTKPVSRDKALEKRFYAIAADDAEEETVTAAESTAKQETAADYEKRQESNRRKEEVLIQRQMRIVDELTVN